MKRIIIADDSATARMFVRKCLEIAGCQGAEFLDAENGEEALTILREWGGDLIVTDLIMPVLDGVELLRQLRADENLKHIPIIVITSAKNPAKEAQLIALGARAVLAKPISPASIAPLLQKLSICEKSEVRP